MRLSEIAPIVGFAVERDGDFGNLGLLSHRGGMFLADFYDRKFLPELLSNPDIRCVITAPEFCSEVPAPVGLGVCDDPMAVFYDVHNHLFRNTDFYWQDFVSEISPEATVAGSAHVASRNVRIGPGTVIEPNVTVLERSIIGANVTIRAGVVIGGEGFEPKVVRGKHVIIPHAGGVRIGDGVEIQSASHVARSVFGGFTEIGDGTKLDALVHVAHNVKIGARCEIAAGAVISGSATLGEEVWVGPNATISNGVQIGERAYITLGSVVIGNVEPGQRVTGYFAVEHARFKRALHRLLR